MAFFNQAINILQTLVVAIGAGLAVWGVINLLEGYGNDNPGRFQFCCCDIMWFDFAVNTQFPYGASHHCVFVAAQI